LPPYQKGKSLEWYRGTANAIYQNMAFIEQYQPDYVLILSGDHIYKMDYNAMLNYHIRHGADATIAVREVPWEEAPRFGIMNTDSEDRIIEFEEKPKNPKSNKASMGVYIFTWEKLRNYLIQDDADKKSSNDFGKNIIPNMLNDKQILVAYDFNGYWKDVGTIESLWEANMDLLLNPMPIDMHDKKWRIFAKNPGLPPHYIADGAIVKDSLITEGCEVYGKVNHSILFSGVIVEEGADVEYSVVMPGSIIRRGAVVRRSIIAENAVVGAGTIVGEDAGNIAVVGQGITLPAGVSVPAGAQVDAEYAF
jgi:glucose-1-phosphate adenylyltransferase